MDKITEDYKKGYMDAIEKYQIPRSNSWIELNCVCKDCDSNIIICQPSERGADYWYYCSNKKCKNHETGEQLGDQEECYFAKDLK